MRAIELITESISGIDMLRIYKATHHGADSNPQMERWIERHDWGIKMLRPEQIPDENDPVYFNDPFGRVQDLDPERVRYFRIKLRNRAPVKPIIKGPGRSIIDGNHRAQAAKQLNMSIQAYVPMNVVSEGSLTEFDRGEGGFGPFKVYVDNHFIEQFTTFNEAKDEVDFLRETDPKSANNHWRIVDGTGETVWEYDIGAAIDALRGGNKIQFRDPGQQGVAENFADGKVKGRSRPGRVRRAGASCKGSVTDLRARARKSGGEKGKMYHWCANMKAGKKR